MSGDPGSCELLAVSLEDSDSEPGSETCCDGSVSRLANGGSSAGILSAEGRDAPLANGAPDSDTDPEAEHGLPASPPDCGVAATSCGSAGTGICAVHGSELDWFCKSEGKLICSHCAIVGSCHGHRVTPVARRATDVRNQLVDVCEKIQLQALRIETFVKKTLFAKERALQMESSRVRERVMAQMSLVREALEEEEQRLLEEVQREQERVQEGLLTHRAHWTQALASLTRVRADLVHTLTHTDDSLLVVSSQNIAERVEEAEGVGEPRDTEQLNLDPACSDSPLLQALWTSTVLSSPSGPAPERLKFDERTVSPLLTLSEDQRTLTVLPKRARQSPQYDPARFDGWPNALCSGALSGTHRWELEVRQSAAFKVGVCYASMARKGSGSETRLGHNAHSWALSLYDGDFSFCHAGRYVALRLLVKPERVGVLLDWPGRTLLFYDPDSGAVLHTVTHAFTAPLLAACAVADHSVTLLH